MIYWKQKGLSDGQGMGKEEAQDYFNLVEAYEKLDSPTKLTTLAKIQGYLLGNHLQARQLFDKALELHTTFVDAHIEYWRYLFRRKEYQSAKLIAEKALQASEAISVPTSLWVETRVILSKSYIFEKDVEKAVETLKDICFLLPPFAIDDLNFIDTVIT